MRSKLFVPATRPALLPKALGSAADAVCLDLEDAVAESEKAEARAQAARLLDGLPHGHGKTLMVRINGLETAHAMADLEAVVHPGVHMVNLPKVESPDQVRHLANMLEILQRQRGLPHRIGIIANIESPLGVRRAHRIASAHPSMAGLQLGFGDLFEPLGIDRSDPIATGHVQMRVRLAAGEAGIAAYDAAYADIADADGYRRQAIAARRLGFAGKTCIHPSQVAAANEVFQPGKEELDFARQVLRAWRDAQNAGVGAITVAGKMVDRPFAERAAALLAHTA